MNRIAKIPRGNSRRRAALAALVMGGFVLTALTAYADHTAISTLLPPGYHSEEALTWCGPATGQMIVAGYPASACTRVQADVDASIQAHKVEANWDTDPEGLRAAITEVCPYPPAHWSIFPTPDVASLMHSAAKWMTRNQYPVAALLGTTSHNGYPSHQEHWVAITAIVTDLDATTNPAVILKWVQFIDPAPPILGEPPTVRWVSGAAWSTGVSPVMTAVTKTPSAYNGMYVAIIEPPPSAGRAVAAGSLLLTGTVIPRAQASRFALEAVQKLKLSEWEAFREFARAKPLEPLLVNAQRGGYYLVPFSVDGKPASVAAIVNAYNGEFQEAGHFAPRAFLAESAALEQARLALRLKQPFRQGEVQTELVSSPDAETPYAPEWRITTPNRTLHVGQRGEFREILRPAR